MKMSAKFISAERNFTQLRFGKCKAYLNGGQVALHAAELALQRHDAGEVHLELVRLLQHAHLVLDPGHRLAALDVEDLEIV